MPATSTTAVGDGASGEVSARLLIESGHLQGLAAHSGEATPLPNTTWAEIGIELGGVALTNRVAILAAGWVGGNQVLGWDGNIPLDPTMAVYIRIWSTLAIPIYLGALSSRS